MYYGSGPVTITLNTKVDDLAIDITLNSKIKVYFRNKWNTTPFLVYYGYITSIDPFIQSGEERTALTCLGAISKLQNDFLQHRTQLYKGQLAYLAYEVENKEIDEHIKEILVNYREKINDTYTDYDPCMIDNPATYWADTNYIKDSSGVGTFRYRYFTMKHLEAIKEITTFLPKTSGNYYYYYLAEDDVSATNPYGKSRFILKTLSATADHTLQINKHITSLSMRRNIEGTINTVYFWNELGKTGEKVLMTAEDSAFQQKYDVIADRITDSKVTTRTQANLLAQSKLEESKDVKAEVTVTVSDANFDILNENNIGLKLGQVINIRDTKRAGRADDTYNLFPDDTLVIQKIILTPREAVLELARPRPDLSTQVETDREYIDKQLVNFGNILTRIDASRLDPGGLHWITDDITFSAVNNAKIQWIGGVTTDVGTFKLPSGVQRVIAGGDTGTMSVGSDYYLYVDEKNVWCGKDTGIAAKESGTGSVKVGENTLIDTGKSWRKDQWKGYALWIDPTGGSEEKHIIAQNYETHLIVEGHDPFNTTDVTCPYEIHPLVLRQTTLRGKKEDAGGFPLQADSGTTTTLVDSALTEVADFWNGFELMILSGQNIGLKRIITDFVATADRLVFDALPFAMANGDYYEIYLNPETQFGIVTGVATSEVTQEAEVLPETPAVENSAYFNASSHIVNKSITANEIKADSITTNEVNFTVPGIGNIIATINASTEGIEINAPLLTIGAATIFSANWEAAANVGALAAKDAVDYATQVSGVKPPGDADHTANIVSAMAYYGLVKDAMEDETIIVGGYIDTNFLTAENIKTGTLTGRKIQTQLGNPKVVMEVSGAYSNQLIFYNNSGFVVGGLKNYVSYLNIWTGVGAGTGTDIRAGNYDLMYLSNVAGTSTGGKIRCNGLLYPSINNQYDIGSSPNNKWKDLHLSQYLYLYGGKINMASDDIICQAYSNASTDSVSWAKHMRPWVNPSGSLGYDLGSSSLKWRYLYVNEVRGTGGNIEFDNAGRLQITNHFDPTGQGVLNFGGDDRYWNWITCNNINKKTGGGVGWLYLDDGVELQDGRKVSDVKAIEEMKPSTGKLSKSGQKTIDPKTLPKIIYKQARYRNGKLMKRDKKDRPYFFDENKKKVLTNDGEDVFATISLLLGAIKEIDKRLKKLE